MSLCRACLSSNLGMYHIDDTGLHDKFESISKIKYKAGDGRPENVCYICCKLLHKFYDFIEMAQTSEKIFKMFIRNGVEITKHELSHLQKRNHNYCCSRLRPISIGGALNTSLPVNPIKKEVLEINRNTYAEYVGVSDILNDFEEQHVKEDSGLESNLILNNFEKQVKEDLVSEESNVILDDLSLNFNCKLVSISEDNVTDLTPTDNLDQDCVILDKKEETVTLDEWGSDALAAENSPLVIDVKKEKEMVFNQCATCTIEHEVSPRRVDENQFNSAKINTGDGIVLVKKEKDLVSDNCETCIIEDDDSPFMVGEKEINHINSNAKDGINSVNKEEVVVLDTCETYIIKDDDQPHRVDEKPINPSNNNAEHSVILVKKENDKVLGNCETYIVEDEIVKLDEIHTNPMNNKAQDYNILVKKETAVLDDSVTGLLEDGELPFILDETYVNVTNNKADSSIILIKNEYLNIINDFETFIREEEASPPTIDKINIISTNNNAEDGNISFKKKIAMVLGECESDILEDGEIPTVNEKQMHIPNSKTNHGIVLVNKDKPKDFNATKIVEYAVLPTIDKTRMHVSNNKAKHDFNSETKNRHGKYPRNRNKDLDRRTPKKYFKPSEYIRTPVNEQLTDFSEDEDSPLMIDEKHCDLECQSSNENQYATEPLILSDANHALFDDFGVNIDSKTLNNVGENQLFYSDSDKSPRKESKSTQSIEKPKDEYLSDISDDEEILRMLEEEHINLQSQCTIEEKYSDHKNFVENKPALFYDSKITNKPYTISDNDQNTKLGFADCNNMYSLKDPSLSRSHASNSGLLKESFEIERENNVNSTHNCLNSNTAVDKRRENKTIELSETPLNCNSKFKRRRRKNPKKIVSNSMIYECEDCDNTYFSRQDSLVQHMKEKHPCRKAYACTYCTNKFYICKHLMEHIRIHHAEERTKLTCEICGKKNRTHHRYLLHKNHCQNSKKVYSCETCQKKYKDRLSFKYHILFVHPKKTNTSDVS